MKKLALTLILALYSLFGFSQVLFESFENTTGPDPLPSTNWPLGSGNWFSFNNNVGVIYNWNVWNNSVPSDPPLVYSGQNAAYVRNENIADGSTSEDYLVTPLITVPSNGELSFYSRTFVFGNQGTLYQIKISTDTTNPTDPNSYTLLTQFTESELSTVFNIYEEKTVDLSAYTGTPIHIAFVRKHTQSGTNSGDRWLLDDVTVQSNSTTCPNPSLITVTPTSFTDAAVSWNETGSATQWEVVLNGGAPIITSSNPFLISGLTPGDVNIVMVRAICSPTDTSNWTVFTFIIPTCNTPTNVTVTGITANGANIEWSNQGSSQWEVLVLPAGSPAPTASSSGISVTSTSYLVNGLTSQTAYDVYIKPLCDFITTSNWSTVVTFTTLTTSTYLNANTTQYNSEQLISNVLLNNPCIAISNVTSSTGTNFGSVNGISYFTNTNINFPISSGIILSTGNAINAHGPNTSIIGEGASTWLGDTQLEAIISTATGTIMNSYNATKLEFDFTSLNEFMSFNFLFASEEYGAFQCTFSDAFAFLLTDLATGTTTNLAVVPGTYTPISVLTIRDIINNSCCNSVNPAFFGVYNGNNNTTISSTNFNGQTVLMTASSAILPFHPYHIKLVVADRGDSAYDSAVFIEAGSFTSGPPECNQKVQLVAFVDTNNNGIKEQLYLWFISITRKQFWSSN
jgi:Cleaved Adhesin Domain